MRKLAFLLLLLLAGPAWGQSFDLSGQTLPGMNVTGAAGYKLNGVSVIGNNLSSSNGNAAGPAIQITVPSTDLFLFSPFIRQNQFQTTLAPSAATTNIWENFFNSVTLNGPGVANGEINVLHGYFQVNAGATANTAEDYEASMFNSGSIGGFVDYLALSHNTSTATVTGQITGLSVNLTNDNTTAGSVQAFVALQCTTMNGAGSQPTSNYCLLNRDPNQLIATAGDVHIGGIGGTGGILLEVTGPDNSGGTFPFAIKNLAGTNAFAVSDAGSILTNGIGAVSCAAGTVNLSTFVVTNGFVTHC